MGHADTTSRSSRIFPRSRRSGQIISRQLCAHSKFRRLKMKTRQAVLVGIITLITALPALAHHSFAAEFDETKPIALKGVVSKVEWENPHVYFYVDVQDGKGNVANWGVESTSVVELIHRGWSHDSLKVGDHVTVEGFTAKDGSRLVGA